MSTVQFSSITTDEGQQFITAFANGRLLGPVDNTHPNFAAIADEFYASLNGQEVDAAELTDLFDVAAAVAAKFDSLSERIKVAHGSIYLDGEVIENALTKQILRFMDEGVADWQPLVAFFEKVLSNPNEHSREQLYAWLDKHDFTIASDGDIVAYKGVAKGDDGVYHSISRGSEDVLVNNVVHKGQIPNPVGATIEMSRSLVHHDPSQGCSRGLHVGTHGYASSFGRYCLEVRVNPRDVVSVPTDCDWQKVRVCRYQVVDVIERQYDTALLADADVDNADDDEFDLLLDGEGAEWYVGDRGRDEDGDLFTVAEIDGDDVVLAYDLSTFGQIPAGFSWLATSTKIEDRRHPAQDEKGRFSNGRPGSQRDASTGRFC